MVVGFTLALGDASVYGIGTCRALLRRLQLVLAW